MTPIDPRQLNDMREMIKDVAAYHMEGLRRTLLDTIDQRTANGGHRKKRQGVLTRKKYVVGKRPPCEYGDKREHYRKFKPGDVIATEPESYTDGWGNDISNMEVQNQCSVW
jgi:hypothetical protein